MNKPWKCKKKKKKKEDHSTKAVNFSVLKALSLSLLKIPTWSQIHRWKFSVNIASPDFSVNNLRF